jgi:diguanylate cyclase (GGDEF)-like protein
LTEREIALARRTGHALAVVYIDVDDLKERNDTSGHDAGDAMLIELADVARRVTRSTDLVGRLGGDEFALVLANTGPGAVDEIVGRLRDGLRESPRAPIGFSAGIVAGTVAGDLDADSLVRAADLSMMEAKAAGKGRTVVRGIP